MERLYGGKGERGKAARGLGGVERERERKREVLKGVPEEGEAWSCAAALRYAHGLNQLKPFWKGAYFTMIEGIEPCFGT